MKLLAALLLVTSLVAVSATAEDHREREHWHGDIHYFHEHDLRLWRTGHWYHGNHLGHPGFWWVVNGIWYPYPRQVAMIPDPYIPPPLLSIQVNSAPPAPPLNPNAPTAAIPKDERDAPQPPAGSAPPPGPPASWYYCANPHGYYPYVTTCAAGWTSVPATPPPGP